MKTSTLFKAYFVLPALFTCTLAIAQDTAGDAAAKMGRLEEIIVTATRRETNLQTTPISISVIDSQLFQPRLSP